MNSSKNLDHFDETERRRLHELAELFEDKGRFETLEKVVKSDGFPQLVKLVNNGATLLQLVNAYNGQKYMVGFLKGAAGLVAAAAVIYGAFRGFGSFLKGG